MHYKEVLVMEECQFQQRCPAQMERLRMIWVCALAPVTHSALIQITIIVYLKNLDFA